VPFKTIRLELARNPQHPEGSNAYGYQFVAPLRPDGHIDADLWHKEKARCRVHRFWRGEPDKEGRLIHTKRKTWAFSYQEGDEDDEDFFKLDQHVFVVGEYVTIREPDGSAPTFRVVTVR